MSKNYSNYKCDYKSNYICLPLFHLTKKYLVKLINACNNKNNNRYAQSLHKTFK